MESANLKSGNGSPKARIKVLRRANAIDKEAGNRISAHRPLLGLTAHSRSVQAVSLILDVLAATTSFFVAAWLTNHSRGLILLGGAAAAHGRRAEALSSDYLLFLFTSVFAWIGAMRVAGIYRTDRGEGIRSLMRAYIQAQIVAALAGGFLLFALKLNSVSRVFVCLYFSLGFVLLIAKQLMMLSLLRHLRNKDHNTRDAVIFGEEHRATSFARGLVEGAGYRAARVVAESGLRDADNLSRILSPSSGCGDFGDFFFLLSGSGVSDLDTVSSVLLKQGKRVHIILDFLDVRFFRCFPAEFAGIPSVSLGGSNVEVVEALAKRGVDIIGGALLAVVFSPIMAIVAILVKLSSKGPVFFAQERLGRDGKRFRLYKFRSMLQDAEQLLSAKPDLQDEYLRNNYKVPENRDPRITSVGRLLRRTSLDELPQLFNVIMGDMSLVGPRPIVPREIEHYGDYARLFLSTKPGLTGLWQVSGRSTIDYPKRAEIDLEYIRDQSLRNDVDILMKTFSTIVTRKGAY